MATNYLTSIWKKELTPWQSTTTKIQAQTIKPKFNLFDGINKSIQTPKPKQLNFAPQSTSWATFQAPITPTQAKPTSFTNWVVPQANADNTQNNNLDKDKIKRFIDFWKQQNKSKEEIKKAYDKALSQWIFNKQTQPQEEWFFDKVRYKPYSKEEVTAFDPNKSMTTNLLEWQGRYAKNVAWWLYNIIPWIAQLWTWLAKWVWTDVYKKIGWLFWMDNTEYNKWQKEKTGALLSWIVKTYADNYWSVEWFKKAVIEDPTTIVADALTVLWVWLAGKSKLTTVQKSALQTQKSRIINQVKNATTLEQKSALIKKWIETSKQILDKTKSIQSTKEAIDIVNKYNPYIAVPKLAVKWTVLWTKLVAKWWKKLIPNTQKISEKVSTKANRFNALDEQKFINTTWETPWQFAVNRWMNEVWTKAVDKAIKNYTTSVEQADNAFAQIKWKYKYTWKWNDPLKLSLDDLEKRFINTENDKLSRIQELKRKYELEWLEMPEINELKREYSNNFKYWFEERNSEALARSSNIQNKLREWQFEKANDLWLTNIREINKNTQSWKMFADSLEKKLNRSWANNAVSITDWITLSWWNISNLALFLWKKIWTSDMAKKWIIKLFWKQTKPSIIKPNINKPEFLKLPAGWQSSYKKPATILPLSDKEIIRESKLPLNKTKYGTNNNISSNMNNTRLDSKSTINKPTTLKQKTWNFLDKTATKVWAKKNLLEDRWTGMSGKVDSKKIDTNNQEQVWKLLDLYKKQNTSSNKTLVIDSDNIKKMFIDYNPNKPELVHRPSSDLSQKFYEQSLKENPNKKVVLLAWGWWSGKSEILVKNIKNWEPAIVFDWTGKNYDKMIKNYELAKKHWKTPSIEAVFIDFNKAKQFNLKRDRVVSLDILKDTHSWYRKTLLRITKERTDISVSLKINVWTKIWDKLVYLKVKEKQIVEFLSKRQELEKKIIRNS